MKVRKMTAKQNLMSRAIRKTPGICSIYSGFKPFFWGHGSHNTHREDFIDFVVDMEREKYLLTYNPRGFLKRIR